MEAISVRAHCFCAPHFVFDLPASDFVTCFELCQACDGSLPRASDVVSEKTSMEAISVRRLSFARRIWLRLHLILSFVFNLARIAMALSLLSLETVLR